MDRVENHVEQGRDYTEEAKKQLYQASVYATKARKVSPEQYLSYNFLLLYDQSTEPFEIINPMNGVRVCTRRPIPGGD